MVVGFVLAMERLVLFGEPYEDTEVDCDAERDRFLRD